MSVSLVCIFLLCSKCSFLPWTGTSLETAWCMLSLLREQTSLLAVEKLSVLSPHSLRGRPVHTVHHTASSASCGLPFGSGLL